MLIDIKNLRKMYRTDEVETTALSSINIGIEEGEFVAIMGPSGCGKSTFLNILGLLDTPDGGSYKFNGLEMSKLSERQRSRVRKSNIGFVFQSFNLIDELSVFENIELPLIYLKTRPTERKERVNRIMNRMGIDHRAKHYPQQLSGGQQQRVAVARALIAEPKIILADEPTGNLDSAHGNEVMELLRELNRTGTTVVMATHSLHDAHYASRIIRFLDGEVIAENSSKTTEDLL